MNSAAGRIPAELLRDIFVQPVIIRAKSVAVIDLGDLPEGLVLASARDKPQREFAAGRLAAKQAGH